MGFDYPMGAYDLGFLYLPRTFSHLTGSLGRAWKAQPLVLFLSKSCPSLKSSAHIPQSLLDPLNIYSVLLVPGTYVAETGGLK